MATATLRPLRLAYALYAGAVFLVLGLAALVIVAALPGLERRRRLTRAMACAFLRAVGMPLTVRGLERLPQGQCVLVANHASYLDGVVLTAALPPRFAFVIKREMTRVPLVAALLRRIGSEFVERFEPGRTTADTRRVVRSAVNGHSLVFFPEGTFSPRPGLMKFHAGAFITAARARCPVVPAVIHGTREALPPGQRLPAPARLNVELLAALAPAAPDDSEPARLRESARNAILAHLREPDLAAA
jgi:1-acyl-sn-glycerol-3-phosphate acyltransferase